MPIEALDETAREILNAASRRFLHYGFRKTTMSEIANDCNMSTGNLYRYFPSKLDIAETFVRVLRQEAIGQLSRIAEDNTRNAADKLRQFFHHKCRYAYDRFHNNPKAYELSAELITERPKLAMEWEANEGRILAGILAEGERAGLFAIGNPARMARIVQDAAFRFTGPGVIREGEFDEIIDELDGVLDLVLDGFAWRARQKC